jgi:hypothetical protein
VTAKEVVTQYLVTRPPPGRGARQQEGTLTDHCTVSSIYSQGCQIQMTNIVIVGMVDKIKKCPQIYVNFSAISATLQSKTST